MKRKPRTIESLGSFDVGELTKRFIGSIKEE